MRYFAKIDYDTVVDVIICDEEVLESIKKDDKGNHLYIETFKDGSLRGNYALIGHTYNSELDIFHEVQPYESWTLNMDTYIWEAPIPYPSECSDCEYEWDEENKTWKKTFQEE